MVTAHRDLAIAVLAVIGLAAAGGLYALWRRREPGYLLRNLLALVQTVLIAQIGLGLLLIGDGRRADGRMHYVYGALALAAALSPWVYAPREPRGRLAWFVGATLLAGVLAARAYMTS